MFKLLDAIRYTVVSKNICKKSLKLKTILITVTTKNDLKEFALFKHPIKSLLPCLSLLSQAFVHHSELHWSTI